MRNKPEPPGAIRAYLEAVEQKRPVSTLLRLWAEGEKAVGKQQFAVKINAHWADLNDYAVQQMRR